jgi:hypothetical protein
MLELCLYWMAGEGCALDYVCSMGRAWIALASFSSRAHAASPGGIAFCSSGLILSSEYSEYKNRWPEWLVAIVVACWIYALTADMDVTTRCARLWLLCSCVIFVYPTIK